MKRTGAQLAVYALEQLGVRFTFGIPGVHITELYDELAQSKLVTPILTTHEAGAAFMADAVSRTSGTVGTLAVVPAAGLTHAMSGIGEAFLDGIPMLVLAGGVRRDTGRHYQLHELDQQRLVAGVVKGGFLVETHEQVVGTIYRAFELATSGEPGPVFVELPADILMRSAEVASPPRYVARATTASVDPGKVSEALSLLVAAKRPGIYVGWGARAASAEVVELAERLGAPVATTLQGLSAFPAQHPLHTGMGFGAAAVPAARGAFAHCDALLAVGVRFSELATGSYSCEVPRALIHVDINPSVFDRNYPARLALEGDAKRVLRAMVEAWDKKRLVARRDVAALHEEIRALKEKQARSWQRSRENGSVGPGFFFAVLRRLLPADAFLVTDDGNHTYLAAELFPVRAPGRFISPTDFNCMGYGVPAAIGVKLANRSSDVVAIVGDGGFLMTGLEALTASTLNVGVVLCVFNDGELAQISQLQQVALRRKTCTVLGEADFAGIAAAAKARYLRIECDAKVESTLSKAIAFSRVGQVVIVDVRIDYSRKTEFTKGILKVNFARLPLKEKLRFARRALKRHVAFGGELSRRV